MPIFKVKIEEVIKKRWKPLITVRFDDSINNALNLFKSKKISKLVVVDYQGKLKGVLSYYDLINFIISPKFKESKGDRIGNKGSFYNYHVKTFAKSYVLTMNKEKSLHEVIDTIINKKIGSVIIIDKERRPLDIITSSDILKFYINQERLGFFKQVSSKIGKLLLRKKT